MNKKKNRINQNIKNLYVDCNEHIESIRKRMDSIPGIIIDNFGLSAHLGKKFSSGCKACKKNKWTVVFIGKACNCKCYYCPQTHNKPDVGSKTDTDGIIATSGSDREYYTFLLIKLKNATATNGFEALGYSGGEPFLYLDRIKHYAKELSKIQSGLYQYVYTNGVAVTEDGVKELRDVGIEEIRLNLEATNFSNKIIDKMRYIRKIVPFLTIEIPPLKDSCLKIKKHIHKFIDIGVDQINFSELLITQHNVRYFTDEPYYSIQVDSLEDVKKGRIAPAKLMVRYVTWSRHITYDVMEMAAREKWPITINDCSSFNHYKPTMMPFGL